MTIAFESVSSPSSLGGSPLSVAHTPSSASKVAICMFKRAGTTDPGVTGITYGGNAMTRLANSVTDDGANTEWIELWYYAADIATSMATIEATWSAGGSATLWVTTYTATNNISVIDSDGTEGASSNSLSRTLDSAENDLLVAFYMVQNTGITASSSTGGTQRGTFSAGGRTNWLFDQPADSSPASTTTFTISQTGAADDTAMSAVTLRESAGGGSGGKLHRSILANSILTNTLLVA